MSVADRYLTAAVHPASRDALREQLEQVFGVRLEHRESSHYADLYLLWPPAQAGWAERLRKPASPPFAKLKATPNAAPGEDEPYHTDYSLNHWMLEFTLAPEHDRTAVLLGLAAIGAEVVS